MIVIAALLLSPPADGLTYANRSLPLCGPRFRFQLNEWGKEVTIRCDLGRGSHKDERGH